MKKHISPCNCDTCIKAKQKELDEQKERASDFYACCLADIVEEIKNIEEWEETYCEKDQYLFRAIKNKVIKIIKK